MASSTRTEPVVRVDHLRKTYGSVAAADDVSFEVFPAEIFGLLGPNGAGKTTSLECLEGLRRPDSGAMTVMGVDAVREAARLPGLLGVQLQSSGLPDGITVDEAMRLFCAYHRVAPRYDLLEQFGLGDKRRAQFHLLSAGQQRRLALMLAIAPEPKLVILDEPTAGLDVASRAQLHDIMRGLRAKGTTIILSSHDMAEVEQLADRVTILLRGRTVATGTPRELTASGGQLTRITVRTQASSLAGDAVIPNVSQRDVQGEYIIYFSSDVAASIGAILARIAEQGDTLVDLRMERPSLEERFLEITAPGGRQ